MFPPVSLSLHHGLSVLEKTVVFEMITQLQSVNADKARGPWDYYGKLISVSDSHRHYRCLPVACVAKTLIAVGSCSSVRGD